LKSVFKTMAASAQLSSSQIYTPNCGLNLTEVEAEEVEEKV